MTDKYLSDVYKLKNLIRYNTRTRLKDESVAEHSFFVSLFTLELCKKYKINEYLTAQCCIKAILHDLPEIELNDITHDVKEKLNLRRVLKPYEDEYYKTHYCQYSDLMINGTELINAIVDLADAYSVKQYTQHELVLGNRSEDMLNIYHEIIDRVMSLTSKLEEILNEKV